ncbi:MAG: GerMN domain-containing protein [Patescibacteria group bacterium]
MIKKIVLIILIVAGAGGIVYGVYQYSNYRLTTPAVETGTEEIKGELKPEATAVRVYFNNINLNPNSADCSQVYPLSRVVPKNTVIPQSALAELFKGPTEKERAQGYTSWFSSDTENILKNIKIKAGTAYVDLRDIRQIIPNASTSCGSAGFLAEVETTLKQFSAVEKVVIALEGRPDYFYEWIQVGCSPDNNLCDETPFK